MHKRLAMQKGRTLLELLAVMVLMALLSIGVYHVFRVAVNKAATKTLEQEIQTHVIRLRHQALTPKGIETLGDPQILKGSGLQIQVLSQDGITFTLRVGSAATPFQYDLCSRLMNSPSFTPDNSNACQENQVYADFIFPKYMNFSKFAGRTEGSTINGGGNGGNHNGSNTGNGNGNSGNNNGNTGMKDDGESCGSHGECQSGICAKWGQCSDIFCISEGGSCHSNDECCSGFECGATNKCVDPTNLVICNPGTYKNNNRCEPCPDNTYSTIQDANSCTPCDSGKINNDTRTGCICPNLYAEECDEYGITTACQAGYMLDGDRCVFDSASCEPGTYPVENECLPCPDSYATECDSSGGSTGCIDGYELRYYECIKICETGKYPVYNEESGKYDDCQPCPNNALTCDDFGNATSCPDNYFRRWGWQCTLCPNVGLKKCKETDFSCLDGYYKNEAECTPCPDTNAVKCADGTGTSTVCKEGYTVNGTTCVSCGLTGAATCVFANGEFCPTSCKEGYCLLGDKDDCYDPISGNPICDVRPDNAICTDSGFDCISGYYFDDNSQRCLACTGRTYSSQGAWWNCSECSPGKKVNATHSSCDVCDAGDTSAECGCSGATPYADGLGGCSNLQPCYDWDSNECGQGYYCDFQVVRHSDISVTRPGVCKAIPSHEELTLDLGELGTTKIHKYKRNMNWMSAASLCNTNHNRLVTHSDLGLPRNNRPSSCACGNNGDSCDYGKNWGRDGCTYQNKCDCVKYFSDILQYDKVYDYFWTNTTPDRTTYDDEFRLSGESRSDMIHPSDYGTVTIFVLSESYGVLCK